MSNEIGRDENRERNDQELELWRSSFTPQIDLDHELWKLDAPGRLRKFDERMMRAFEKQRLEFEERGADSKFPNPASRQFEAQVFGLIEADKQQEAFLRSRFPNEFAILDQAFQMKRISEAEMSLAVEHIFYLDGICDALKRPLPFDDENIEQTYYLDCMVDYAQNAILHFDSAPHRYRELVNQLFPDVNVDLLLQAIRQDLITVGTARIMLTDFGLYKAEFGSA